MAACCYLHEEGLKGVAAARKLPVGLAGASNAIGESDALAVR